MESTNEVVFNPKYLQDQLITARKEISNLRQQLKNLRYVHERDVNNIKRLLGVQTSSPTSFMEDSLRRSHSPSGFLNNLEPSTSSNSNLTNANCLNLRPIGTISTWFPNKRGTPRQPVICSRVPGKLTLNKSTFTNPEHALQGLEEFSHMWILFHFHRNDSNHVRAKVSPPRLNGLRTGVFSTRSPHRPCPVGLSLVKIIKVDGYSVYFEGVDMVDQTPVLDIKPYIPQYDNPVHIGKVLHTVAFDEDLQETDVTLDNLIAASANQNNTSYRFGDRAKNQQVNLSASSSSSSLFDISRDEEIALTLQAQEFQDISNYDTENNAASAQRETSITSNLGNRDSISSAHRITRNSRFLDGADGPNTICGTDVDLITRQASNLRILNDSSSSSPVRMGVREAPDGEEGFEATQSQSFLQASSTLISNNGNTDNSKEAVRVPDWLARPKTTCLFVVFNERSLLQLHEILNENAEEKKIAIENVLKEDPRSIYLRQRYGSQFYTFLIHDLHITCRFDDEKKMVTVFQIRNAGRMCECGQPEWQCTGHATSPVHGHS